MKEEVEVKTEKPKRRRIMEGERLKILEAVGKNDKTLKAIALEFGRDARSVQKILKEEKERQKRGESVSESAKAESRRLAAEAAKRQAAVEREAQNMENLIIVNEQAYRLSRFIQTSIMSELSKVVKLKGDFAKLEKPFKSLKLGIEAGKIALEQAHTVLDAERLKDLQSQETLPTLVITEKSDAEIRQDTLANRVSEDVDITPSYEDIHNSETLGDDDGIVSEGED